MDKRILLALLALALITGNAAAANTWANTGTVDVNGAISSPTGTATATTENGILCIPDDGNFTVTIEYGATHTGVNVTYFASADGGTTTINTKGVWADTNGYMDSNDRNFHTDILGHGQFTVAAPTVEGLYRMRVYDANAVDTNYYDEWVAVKPDSTYTEFTFTESGDSNGFCKIGNYATFRGTIGTSYGELETIDALTWDLSSDIDFDTGIDMAATNPNKFTFNLSQLQNKKGKITFLKPQVATSQFQIRRNDSGCDLCGNIEGIDSFTGKQISFTTTSINDSPTNYEIVELAAGGGGGEGGSGGGTIPIGGGTFTPGLPSLGDIADTNTILMYAGVAIVVIAVVAYWRKK